MLFVAKRDKKIFLEANNVRDFEMLTYLIWMNYIINRRGYCYDADLAYLKKTTKNKLPMRTVRKKLWSMMCDKLVNYVRAEKLHPVLKRRYIITERGYSVLDNYTALLTKKEREIDYLLKKVHIDADKLAEKD